MAIKINKEFISKQNTYAGQNDPRYIAIHETDNFSKGAGARRHAEAQAAGHLSTSVHYYAGSDGIYQEAEHSDGVWAVGREYESSHSVKDATNRNTINIEICVNVDGDYSKARQNAIGLVKTLMQETGIPAGRVIRHFDAKGKYCPRRMMDDPALWEDFKAQIGGKPASVQQSPAVPDAPDGQGTLRAVVVTERDPLLIRDAPNGNRVASIPKGAEVEVLETGSEWHKVKYGGHIGYSAARYLSVSGGVKCVAQCTGNGVRVRRTPDFGDNIVRFLNKGNLFDVLGTSGVWTHISVGGVEGYIYSDYVRRA